MNDYPSKAQWGEGPWQHEPDEVEWVDAATGYTCGIKRALPSPGQLNGYVAVPPTHPAYGLHYDGCTWTEAEARWAHWQREMRRVKGNFKDWQPGPEVTAFPGVGEALEKIEVHGGLTYTGDRNIPDTWWFGFDCAHAFDLSPGMEALMHRIHIEMGSTLRWEHRQKLKASLDPAFHEKYRTIDYVRKECTHLAHQLKTLEVVIDVTSYASHRPE